VTSCELFSQLKQNCLKGVSQEWREVKGGFGVWRGGGYDVEKEPSSGVVWLGGDSFSGAFSLLVVRCDWDGEGLDRRQW